MRNAKRDVVSLRVSHVVAGANERRLYSQARKTERHKLELLDVRAEYIYTKRASITTSISGWKKTVYSKARQRILWFSNSYKDISYSLVRMQ